MNLEQLVWSCVVGLISGWLASKLVHGKGMGILSDMVVGILGAFIGGYLVPRLGIHIPGLMGWIVTSVLGAVVLLLLLRLIKTS